MTARRLDREVASYTTERAPIRSQIVPCPRCGGELLFSTQEGRAIESCARCGTTAPVRRVRPGGVSAELVERQRQAGRCTHLVDGTFCDAELVYPALRKCDRYCVRHCKLHDADHKCPRVSNRQGFRSWYQRRKAPGSEEVVA